MIPNNTWRRRFNEVDPHSSIHNFSRPSLYEILHLLPIAYRVSSYINTERNNQREPIFDMSGIALEPPKPGPHGGVPLGGLGGGSIGKGFRGEFRRWSLLPGRYIHRIVYADVFSIRIKRTDSDEIYSTVLAFHKPTTQETHHNNSSATTNNILSSTLTSWNWNMSDSCGTYYGLHPRSWTVYENPVPHTVVIVKQISPFLPHNYSDSSLPCACFVVEVINTHPTLGMEASVMFSFENADIICDQVHLKDNQCFQIHTQYDTTTTTNTTTNEKMKNSSQSKDEFSIKGVCMANVYLNNKDNNNDNSINNELHHTTSYSIASTNNTMNDLESWIHTKKEDILHFNNLDINNDITQTNTNSNTNSNNSNNNNSSNQRRYMKEDLFSNCTSTLTTNNTSDSDQYREHDVDYSYSARKLWECFTNNGDIQEVLLDNNNPTINTNNNTSSITSNRKPGNDCVTLGSAICLKKWIEPMPEGFSLHDYLFINKNQNKTDQQQQLKNSKLFPFSLSWDCPFINFPGVGSSNSNGNDNNKAKTSSSSNSSGSNSSNSISSNSGNNSDNHFDFPHQVTSVATSTVAAVSSSLARYYTQFFDVSGLSSAKISSFALLNINNWDHDIDKWQNEILSMNKLDDVRMLSSPSLLTPISVMTISATQQVVVIEDDHNLDSSYYDHQLFNELYYLVDGGTIWCNSKQGKPSSHCIHTSNSSNNNNNSSNISNRNNSSNNKSSSSNIHGNIQNYSELETYIQNRMSSLTINELVDHIHVNMLKHTQQCIESNGNQDLIGQFLYLEGHEYLMYNTYDVHFYASFALLMLWPQLELSLQRDFAFSISQEDHTKRTMMGSGDLVTRKVKGCVPHDLGSPSEYPWIKSNAYNFQDVSRWKDLGPKFILQIYRNYDYLISNTSHESKLQFKLQEYLNEIYPILLIVMKTTEAFDFDGDGMIENQGFPDQTYDVWVATGVSAYCGGLWIASCEAISKIAMIQKDSIHCLYYKKLAERARKVYIDKLWNGRYLDYDSSNSAHHDSIMADMMAGQWYSHVCRLPAILNPERSFSCYEMIFQNNVKEFGKGQWIGAVNGMRPPPPSTTTAQRSAGSGSTFIACIDNTCIQSREVWTGTTYALAAAMLHESSSYHTSQQSTTTVTITSSTANTNTDITTTDDHVIVSEDHKHQRQSYLTASQRQQLQHMSNLTAKGIHDGGWQRYGYWFATPEAWEQNGNYRSLGYMRPLCIWAIQFAKQQSVSKHK